MGVRIILMLMAISFLGYVLPWGQISFWGATVITNLVSAIPVVGGRLVEYLWGGFSVNEPTLKRFFALHFFLPFILVILTVSHIIYLHEAGSGNPLGASRGGRKIKFYPYRMVIDLEGLVVLMWVGVGVVLFGGLAFIDDPENFLPANPLLAPLHIQPEWYFLFAYAILRSIPNKLGGVVALVASVSRFYVLGGMRWVKLRAIFVSYEKIIF